MSTLEPLESKQCPEQCETGFNRFRCYMAKLWCKTLSVFEPLCALSEVEFSTLEEVQVTKIFGRWYEAIRINSDQIFSEALTEYPKTREQYAAWLNLAQEHDYIFTAEEQRLARGQLTGFNIIGLAMSYGTTCHCCLGWRAIALGVIGFIAGALIF